MILRPPCRAPRQQKSKSASRFLSRGLFTRSRAWSMSTPRRPGQSLVIVRFLVGTPQEDALIKVYSKLYSNFDQIPPGVSQPIIKARSIDDVPILSLTLVGRALRRLSIAGHCRREYNTISQQIPDVSESTRHRRASADHAGDAQYRQAQCVRPIAAWRSLGICRLPMPVCRRAISPKTIAKSGSMLATSSPTAEIWKSVVVAVDHWHVPFTCAT